MIGTYKGCAGEVRTGERQGKCRRSTYIQGKYVYVGKIEGVRKYTYGGWCEDL